MVDSMVALKVAQKVDYWAHSMAASKVVQLAVLMVDY
jgi:hypothetical protein